MGRELDTSSQDVGPWGPPGEHQRLESRTLRSELVWVAAPETEARTTFRDVVEVEHRLELERTGERTTAAGRGVEVSFREVAHPTLVRDCGRDGYANYRRFAAATTRNVAKEPRALPNEPQSRAAPIRPGCP